MTGESTSGRGLNGIATSGTGVFGQATSGEGVRGTSGGSNGVAGSSGSSVASGVYGENTHGGAGTYGRSNKAGGNGAFGESSLGIGVHGTTDTGTGGYFSANDGGTALHTSGRVQLDNCSGVASVASGANSVHVTPGYSLVANSSVVATLRGNPSGTVTVKSVSVDPGSNTFTIHLTANASSASISRLARFRMSPFSLHDRKAGTRGLSAQLDKRGTSVDRRSSRLEGAALIWRWWRGADPAHSLDCIDPPCLWQDR